MWLARRQYTQEKTWRMSHASHKRPRGSGEEKETLAQKKAGASSGGHRANARSPPSRVRDGRRDRSEDEKRFNRRAVYGHARRRMDPSGRPTRRGRGGAAQASLVGPVSSG